MAAINLAIAPGRLLPDRGQHGFQHRRRGKRVRTAKAAAGLKACHGLCESLEFGRAKYRAVVQPDPVDLGVG